jgi:hypothetical protein
MWPYDHLRIREKNLRRVKWPLRPVPRNLHGRSQSLPRALVPKSYDLIRYWIELYLSTHLHSSIVLVTNCFAGAPRLTSRISDSVVDLWL